MFLSDTKMHIGIFCITIFEFVLLFFQIIYYRLRPSDGQRLRYLVLISLLILYNIFSGGILPDENISVIPFLFQNILAYLLGFIVSMYAIYFYYKLFDLSALKFLATKGLFYFLFASFLILFVLPYLYTGNLEMSRTLTMIIPIGYGVWFIYKATQLLFIKFKESKQQGDSTDAFYLAITAYFSMVCWAFVPIINMVGDHQVIEHSLTNAGFVLMSIFYIRSVTKEPKEAPKVATSPYLSYEEITRTYELSKREAELLPLLLKGDSYKQIGDHFHISDGTVSKHVSNVLNKVGVQNRVELINKLRPTNWGREHTVNGQNT